LLNARKYLGLFYSHIVGFKHVIWQCLKNDHTYHLLKQSCTFGCKIALVESVTIFQHCPEQGAVTSMCSIESEELIIVK